MALNIKDPETDRLARELSATTGESITVATRQAIQERLDRLRRSPTKDQDLSDIIRRGRTRRTLDRRGEDDILGYDADGLPT
ncbi:PSK operon transcription factor [Occultella glacieicola]|uniref:PSK operon transcription factor n=1 Tax=Occultella glacieicola TaxID=2518684 RepID=A0ABY2E315_9MICO|nr:type II toxin-antitoxin system VapB family antitoxin [Occultella glacieicola]TDE94013.1 PSK operon transcription factor [Occultella glacieicola]